MTFQGEGVLSGYTLVVETCPRASGAGARGGVSHGPRVVAEPAGGEVPDGSLVDRDEKRLRKLQRGGR